MHNSEKIIDLFRVCARKGKVLSQALEGDFAGFVFEDEKEQAPEPELEMDTTNVEPQPRSMEVELQSKFELVMQQKSDYVQI